MCLSFLVLFIPCLHPYFSLVPCIIFLLSEGLYLFILNSTSLLVRNSFRFVCLKTFFSAFIFGRFFALCRILGCWFFFCFFCFFYFSVYFTDFSLALFLLRDLLSLLCSCVCVCVSFFLTIKIFPLLLVLSSLIVMCLGVLHVSCGCGLWISWISGFGGFIKFGKSLASILQFCFVLFCFPPPFSLLRLGNSHYMFIRPLEVVSQLTDAFSFFLFGLHFG